MPGDSPYEAVTSFLDPLQNAVSCLGPAKLTLSPGGRHEPGKVHSWALNGGEGMRLRVADDVWATLRLTMHYEIVRSDPTKHEGTWRVTTHAYAYELVHETGLVWSMHWHPTGNSPVTFPHLHLSPYGSGHFLTSRHSLESAVQWCIEMGAQPTRENWRAVLGESEGVHRLWASWRDHE